MKILVFGAGVLGCNLSRNLFRAGKDDPYCCGHAVRWLTLPVLLPNKCVPSAL